MKKKVADLLFLITISCLFIGINGCRTNPGDCTEPIECTGYSYYDELTCNCICGADDTAIQECESSGNYEFDLLDCQCKAK